MEHGGSLGLSSKNLETMFGGEDAQVAMRVKHYPKCPQADQVLGLSPHSDAPILIVHLQDEVEGLQVKKDGTWWTVKPIPGALFVNMGDMMEGLKSIISFIYMCIRIFRYLIWIGNNLMSFMCLALSYVI